jgi:hypothetical protein
MATATTTPRKRTAKATTAKAAPAVETVEETEETGLEKIVHTLDNKGRTKGGEGKQVYWNLHEKGVRGQIFTDPDIVEVRVLVVRNPNAAVE